MEIKSIGTDSALRTIAIRHRLHWGEGTGGSRIWGKEEEGGWGRGCFVLSIAIILPSETHKYCFNCSKEGSYSATLLACRKIEGLQQI